MDAQDNGLTLQGLARRLEALERENAELRHKVATLEGSGTRRDEVTALRSSDMRRASVPAPEPGAGSEVQVVSRRWLLSKAGAAAVGTVAAGALLLRDTREAKANHYVDDSIFTDSVTTHRVGAYNDSSTLPAIEALTASDAEVAVIVHNEGSAPGVEGRNEGTGPAILGTAYGSGGTGVKGTGRYGVWGESNQAGFYGLFGRNNTSGGGTGVRGVSANGIGVEGRGKAGVLGTTNTASRGAVEGSNENNSGYGVWGNSSGVGVRGTSSAASLGAVEGHNSGGGAGLVGVGKTGVLAFSHTDGWFGVWDRHTGKGNGVNGDSARGTGVNGGSQSGYGGQFQGGKAQLRLVPGSSAGAPGGAHAKGEVYMDKAATLWVCVKGGNPAEWRKVTTTS